MKNKINNILAFCSVILLSTSCGDWKMLEEHPYSLSEGSYITNYDEAKSMVDGMYFQLRRDVGFGRIIPIITESLSDYCYGRGTYESTFQSGINTSCYSRTQDCWAILYRVVRYSNVLLPKLAEVEMTETQYNELSAEIRFLRGFAYSYLVKCFDDVPFFDENDEIGTDKPKTASEEIWESIISDMEYAVENLPSAVSVAGHPDKTAAYFCLAEACMYLEDYDGAAAAAQAAIDQNVHSLVDVSVADDFEKIFGADVVTAVMESESRDKKAGDRAFAAKDYAVAASFYGKYLEDARKAGSLENTRDAYERLLDALVLGRMPDLAEKTLQDYETAFPGANPLSLSMWRGDILSQRGRYAEAQKIYERILPALASKDPRRMRTLFSYGFVLERLKAYKSAAKVYNILYQQIGASALGKLAFERCVLCTAAAGEPRQALDLLLSYPPNSDSKDFAAYRLLNAYILLKAEGVDAASGAWQALLRDLKGEREPLTYLIASSYGDAFAVTKNYALALDSYRAAFNAAAGKQEAFDTLDRIIQVFSRIGDRQKAAALAVKQLELFKNSLVSTDTKLNTARLLEESGNTEGALQLYESVYSNINSSPEKKREALRRYGMLQGAGNRFREAEKLIRSYYRGAAEADGEFLIGEVLVAHGKVDRYIAVYREIAKKWPALAPRALYLAASAAQQFHLFAVAGHVAQEFPCFGIIHGILPPLRGNGRVQRIPQIAEGSIGL